MKTGLDRLLGKRNNHSGENFSDKIYTVKEIPEMFS